MRLLVVFAIVSIFACNQGAVLIQTPEISFSVNDSLQVFSPGEISSGHYERDLAVSPDGNELFYTLVGPRNRFSAIMHMVKNGDRWKEAEIATFSGKFKDLEPALSPEGSRLFFVSNRNASQDSVKADMDIWYVDKMEGGWSTPIRLDTTINTNADEYYPSMASNGNLYFTATYQDSKGREDIYMSEWKDGIYQKPISLDTTINTASFEFNAYVAPDESYLLYSSFGRADGKGGGDLYISRKDKNGKWAEAIPIERVNSNRLDYSPFVLGDSILFFTSERTHFDNELRDWNSESLQKALNGHGNGEGDIYQIEFKK